MMYSSAAFQWATTRYSLSFEKLWTFTPRGGHSFAETRVVRFGFATQTSTETEALGLTDNFPNQIVMVPALKWWGPGDNTFLHGDSSCVKNFLHGDGSAGNYKVIVYSYKIHNITEAIVKKISNTITVEIGFCVLFLISSRMNLRLNVYPNQIKTSHLRPC